MNDVKEFLSAYYPGIIFNLIDKNIIVEKEKNKKVKNSINITVSEELSNNK